MLIAERRAGNQRLVAALSSHSPVAGAGAARDLHAKSPAISPLLARAAAGGKQLAGGGARPVRSPAPAAAAKAATAGRAALQSPGGNPYTAQGDQVDPYALRHIEDTPPPEAGRPVGTRSPRVVPKAEQSRAALAAARSSPLSPAPHLATSACRPARSTAKLRPDKGTTVCTPLQHACSPHVSPALARARSSRDAVGSAASPGMVPTGAQRPRSHRPGSGPAAAAAAAAAPTAVAGGRCKVGTRPGLRQCIVSDSASESEQEQVEAVADAVLDAAARERRAHELFWAQQEQEQGGVRSPQLRQRRQSLPADSTRSPAG